MTHTSHPRVLTALAIVRNRPELTRRSTIRSVAMLTVLRVGQTEARFQLDHHAFGKNASRAEIISGICKRIPPGATLLTRIPRPPEAYLKQVRERGELLPPADIQLIQKELPGLCVVPMQCADRHLAEAAAAMGIPYASASAPVLERARRAPEHAEALWQLYLWTRCPPQERADLSAAWKAWRALQQARPLGF